MHEPEGALAALPSKTERRMWQQVRQQTFGGVPITEQQVMWNAGVVGIPAQSAPQIIALALRVCDELCRRQVTPRLIEQFALSVALAEGAPLRPARPYIGHYWSTKDQWNEAISSFLLTSQLQGRSVADELRALAGFDFRAAPVKRIDKNTRFRLQRVLERVFPAREISYVGSE